MSTRLNTNTNTNTNITNSSINSIQLFTNSKNLSMLWELLLDELQINPTSTTIVQNIKTVFDGNINLFKTRANPNAGLMNLNKQFLNQLLIAVNQLFPNLKQEQQQQQMKRININEEIIGEPYKVEDIHNARQSDFEKQLINKRNEFENTINAKKPQPIDFSDKVEPELKITEMESLIAETMAKRKYEIEQLQGSSSLPIKPESKTINKKTEKTVSFNDNITYEHIDYNENNEPNLTKEENIINMNNIFSKLKKNINVSQDQNQDELDKEKPSYEIQILEEKIDKLSQKIDTLFTMIEQILNNLYINQEKSF
jgi:hypothetical protein